MKKVIIKPYLVRMMKEHFSEYELTTVGGFRKGCEKVCL